MTRTLLAGALQVAGLLAIAVAVGLLAVWAGVLTFGAGLILFGIAVELGKPEAEKRQLTPIPPRFWRKGGAQQ